MLNQLNQQMRNWEMVTSLVKELVKRRHMRMIAVQTLFQMIEAPDYLTVEDALNYALENGNDPEAGYEAIKGKYVHTLINGVLKHQEDIDQIIEANLSHWTIDRIQRIDLVILRVALFEMKYVDDAEVPNTVAVDEAIELSKGFSDDKSRQFVSGVLMKLLNQE